MIGNVGGGSLHIGYRMRVDISGQFTGGSLLVAGGTLALYGDNPNAVSADLWGGTLLVQGSHPNLNITLRLEMEEPLFASLSGDGLVGDVTAFTGLTRVTPDSTLSVNNVTASSLIIRLNGTNVGEYGRLVASGNVSLGTSSLLPSPGFNPQPGQVFTIVEKTSPGAITNAFLGPEGKIITLNGMPFRLSYVAHAAAADLVEIRRQLVHLRAIVEHPSFVMMKHLAVVLIKVETRGDARLALVGKAIHAPGPLFRVHDRRQQQRREQRDDGDDDEQFNERNCFRLDPSSHCSVSLH